MQFASTVNETIGYHVEWSQLKGKIRYIVISCGTKVHNKRATTVQRQHNGIHTTNGVRWMDRMLGSLE